MYKWELIGLLWLAYFFNQADRMVYNTVLKQIQEDLGLTDPQAGLVASIFIITYALLVPIAGYLGDVFRRKSIIFWSLLFWSGATILSGFSTGLIMLIIFRSLATGGGEAFYYPSANSLISQYHHKTRALAMSIHQTSLYVGIVSSGLISGWIAQNYGWRMAFFVFGSFGIFLALLILWRVKPDPPAHAAIENGGTEQEARTKVPLKEALRTIMRTPSVWAIWIGFATANFVALGYLTWTPSFLQEKFSQDPMSAGFNSTFWHHLFAFVGVLVGARISDLWSQKRIGARLEIQAFGLFLCAPFVLLMALSPSVIGCYVGLAGFGLFRGVFESNLFASLFDVVEPRFRATAVGLMLSVGFVISSASPVLVGMLKEPLGFSRALAMLAPIFLIAALALTLARLFWLKNDFHHDRTEETAE